MPTSTAALAFKQGAETAARAAITTAEPGALITYDWGEPDTWSDDCILFMRLTSDQVPGPISPRRARDETLTLELHVITRRSDQRSADLRAYQLLGRIERHIRMVDPTLGGSVMWCFMTGHEGDGFTPDGDMSNGRGCELIATFTARARVAD